MLKLKTVVRQLSDQHFEGLALKFQKNRAGKHLSLLRFYRGPDLSEEQISKRLGLNKTAYYTLKSRLYKKAQEYLYEHVKDPRMELMRNVANIHNLLYLTPKDTSITILKKLEKKLIEFDMPKELILVYQAFKKIHLYSPKYYEYAQLYNKHVAYTLGLDKAEDLLSKFTKTTGEYLLSRDPEILEILVLMKTQMANVFRLYESHHLAIYKNIMDISFAIFIPEHEGSSEEESVEEMLGASVKIFDQNPRDVNYGCLRLILDFLSFEYYHSLRLHKNASPYFENVNSQLDTFMLSDHCCLVSYFLLSKTERYVQLGKAADLAKESEAQFLEFSTEDVANHVNLALYRAAVFFYDFNFAEAIKCLNEIQGAVSFKNILHTEIEIKLFLALNYSMLNEYELAELVMKSLTRKINEKGTKGYENAFTFIRMLRMQMSSERKDMEGKISKLYEKFTEENNGKNKILRFLKLDPAFIKELSRFTKRPLRAKSYRGASV